MKINDIFESTTSGSVASVAMPMGGTQKREGTLFKGKKTKKKFYEAEVSEAEVNEADLILVPGQGKKLKPGFIPKDQDRTDHEVEMARSDLFHAAQNAKEIYKMIHQVSEDEGLEGWVQEKIIKANDYLNTVREYLEHKTYMQEGGLIAGGMSNFEEGVAEGWKEESQDLEDWSKEVNMRLYRAHETQRPGLARQLSKIEQKNFGSSLNQGSLTEIVKAALMALQKGQMVHYDPQRVGQMPFGSAVGDDAKLIAKYNITRDELAGYRMLHDKNMVDDLEQFLKLRRLVRAKSWPLEYFEELEKLTPEEAWLKMADDLNWSKDDMNEEVQAKTDDKLLAYYAQRKAEKQKKEQGAAEDQVDEEKDACYNKVKSRYKVWPSAYASGALVKCRKVGASNWGNSSKK